MKKEQRAETRDTRHETRNERNSLAEALLRRARRPRFCLSSLISGLPSLRLEWKLILCLALLLGLAACNRHAASAVTASGASAAAENETATLFTVAQDKMAHLQIAPVEAMNLPQVLRLPGSVTYNSFVTTPVITQVSGPVSHVLVFPGQDVTAGQSMLDVSSPDFAQARSNYITARSALWLAQQSYRRAKDLYAHKAIAQSALEQAQAAEEQGQASLTAAEQSLRVLGFTNPNQVMADSAEPEIPLLAPVSGEVVERTVSPGQVIQAGATQCFLISNMHTVWVLANVYQADLSYVHLGDPVVIRTDAYPKEFHGRISYIAPAMDPTTRTLQVRVVTDNPGGLLKKDMYVTVIVKAGVIHGALTVPNDAVLRNSENQPFVYVLVGPRRFARRLVQIGAIQDGRTQIVSGLEPGERVMGQGSLFVEFANSLR
ncbi:MAG: efflux RND transporter periplasmic adaptor subunit [Terriglobia bacterium]